MNILRLTKLRPGLLFVIGCLLLVVCLPLLAGAASLIPCGGSGESGGTPSRQCTFNDLITLGNQVINFLLKDFAMPFAVVLLVWAGLLFMFKSSDSGTLSKAKSLFFTVIVGYIVALAGFLIIKFVLVGLGVNTGLYEGYFR